jgi:hypothetical protein
VTDKPVGFHVDFANGTTYDLDAIRARRASFMPDGDHAWVVSTVYALDDPDADMDTMELGPANFVGVTSIHCLLCTVHYRPEIRYHKCPQTLPNGGWDQS